MKITFNNSIIFDKKLYTFLKYQSRVKYGEASILKIIELINKGNYLQILYYYGIDMLCELTKHFIEEQEYEQCEEIEDCVKNHNKAVGSNLKIIT